VAAGDLGPRLASFRPSARALLPFFGVIGILLVPLAIRRIVLAEDLPLTAALLILVTIPAALLLMFGLLWPLRFLFAVRVHALGIDAYDAWGRRLSLAWPFVGDITTVSLLGLDYLVIEASDSRRSLYLPRFLDDQDRFDQLVIEHAGSNHPLARHLLG